MHDDASKHKAHNACTCQCVCCLAVSTIKLATLFFPVSTLSPTAFLSKQSKEITVVVLGLVVRPARTSPRHRHHLYKIHLLPPSLLLAPHPPSIPTHFPLVAAAAAAANTSNSNSGQRISPCSSAPQAKLSIQFLSCFFYIFSSSSCCC